MELTIFGYACRHHRARMGVVIASQAECLGLLASTICDIERGAEPVTKSYLTSLIKWMELTPEEASELKLRAYLRPKTSPQGSLKNKITSLADILDSYATVDVTSKVLGVGDAA